jgi:sigma-B regulation protein RsbU (phosphoserine phosphatase)
VKGEVKAYGIVIDSVGNYLYHPDKQRIAQETVIEPQTTLLLYTDGLNEAIDADLEMFSEDRIFDELNHAIQDGQLSPKALVERLTQAVHDFVGDTEQSDDLTMMAIHYK